MIRRKLQNVDPIVVAAVMATLAAIALVFAIAAGSASAASGGGVGLPTEEPTVAGAKAKLLNDGRAAAPESAPQVVKDVIAAANRIRNKPYIYGGGHGSFEDKGYDCSGAMSYALHGGNLLASPLDSTGFMRYGGKRVGDWITTYANGGHGYMVVAGLRWDTSGNTDGSTGPSWHKDMRSPKGFVVRHPNGF